MTFAFGSEMIEIMEDREVCGLISRCCPRNSHGKAGNERKRERNRILETSWKRISISKSWNKHIWGGVWLDDCNRSLPVSGRQKFFFCFEIANYVYVVCHLLLLIVKKHKSNLNLMVFQQQVMRENVSETKQRNRLDVKQSYMFQKLRVSENFFAARLSLILGLKQQQISQ